MDRACGLKPFQPGLVSALQRCSAEPRGKLSECRNNRAFDLVGPNPPGDCCRCHAVIQNQRQTTRRKHDILSTFGESLSVTLFLGQSRESTTKDTREQKTPRNYEHDRWPEGSGRDACVCHRIWLIYILENSCRPHASADAHSHETVASVATLEFSDDGSSQLSAGAAQGVS
jgi:hypothetical protein